MLVAKQKHEWTDFFNFIFNKKIHNGKYYSTWQQASHATYQLLPPSCSTRAISTTTKISLIEKRQRIVWREKKKKKLREWTISAKMRGHKEQEGGKQGEERKREKKEEKKVDPKTGIMAGLMYISIMSIRNATYK